MINKLLKKLYGKKELDLRANLWKTDKCYRCGGGYNKNNFWAIFTEINGVIYQVPICDKCSGSSTKEAPHN